MDKNTTFLNRQKGALKAKVTKLEAFLSTQEDINTVEIAVKIESVKTIQASLEALQNDYFSLPDSEDLSAVEEEIADLESRLESLEVRLKSLINNVQISAINSSTSVNQSANNESDFLKLEPIPIPLFFGKYEEWSNFKAQFCSLIDSNVNLSDTQKLYYLRSSLRADAKQIESPEDNYASLFKALEERYENLRLIVDTHVKEIINYEKITTESPKDLRNLIDCLNKNMRALKVLKFTSNDLSDVFILNIVLTKIDRETRKGFESTIKDKNVPKLESFLKFLENRIVVLENIGRSAVKQAPVKPSNYYQNKAKAFLVKNNDKICILCKQPHFLFRCKTFREMNVSNRLEFIKEKRLCFNCLQNHNVAQCKSNYKCSICNYKHNSLLHLHVSNVQNSEPTSHLQTLECKQKVTNHNSVPQQAIVNSSLAEENASNKLTFSLAVSGKEKNVLLSTAEIYLDNVYGDRVCVRALLDSGSQLNLMTTECADILGIRKEKIKTTISGISGVPHTIKHKVKTKISDCQGCFTRDLDFLIVPKISDLTPATTLDISELNLPECIKLADPKFFSPDKIHLLIGNELFFEILKSERIRTADGKLLLHNTIFGFLVTGTLPSCESQQFCGFVVEEDNLDKAVQQFFETEALPGEYNQLIKGEEDQYCEEHFRKTYTRDETGRYIVRMPVKNNDPSVLGDSKEMATRRLNAIWKRLDKNATMCNLYKAFMTEYLELNHMEEISQNTHAATSYYIPHHAVFRADNVSTPCRVVFDASAKTTSGCSLNSILMNGGNIQQDLFSIILRFRTHRYAFTADIKKMYRQILIDPSQRDLQRIVWKESISAPIKLYRLRTITYGTLSASFLATRTLKALAEDEGKDFPRAAIVLCSDTYMDDILTGCDTLPEARTLQQELIDLLQRAGMQLHKWVSNSSKLYEGVQANETYTFHVQSDHNTTSVKALGMLWTPTSDYFSFNVSVQQKEFFTKRDVLSQIAKLFDPLGLIGPVITKAKIFLQTLWSLNLSWHEALPSNALLEWKELLHQLSSIDQLNINRYVLAPDAATIEIHGFSDASQRAYGAAIYLRYMDADKHFVCNLLCSKSRVAPIKTLTIPRLELCAALLLARLMKKIEPVLNLNINDVFFYTDSTIVLAWLNTSPHKLKTFVSHRVAEIQSLTKNTQWKHVCSSDNPADVISRGMNANDLMCNSLWWHGPQFLQQNIPETNTPANYISCSEEQLYIAELKNSSNLVLSIKDSNSQNFVDYLLHITNNYLKLIRIVSFLFRFTNNCKNSSGKLSGPLTSHELQNATKSVIKLIQSLEFQEEIKALKKDEQIPKGSKLKFLNPFLDKYGLLRVGGRLTYSDLEFDQKHQIILPSKHKITKMIFQYFHKKYFHIGPQGLLHYVRMQFWPVNAKNIARKVVHDCIVCFRNNPNTATQIMGNLPSERITPDFPFKNTGVDFCGPFEIKYKTQRKGSFHKIYVSIFICLVTKAIHIEIVTDLTSDAFVAALKRFFSRRGKSSYIISDNATNFKGAKSELTKLHNLINKPDENLANYLASESIEWKFIPPRSPHFGGLWEAGVKSFKYFLKRTLKGARLTLEEFLTLSTQIEGILNSRPLTPLSTDINDFQALTPGHFLIGRPITAIPEPQILNIQDSRLSRWQRVTKFVQLIWKNWNLNYLSHLQNRSKWQFQKNNVAAGTMVVIKDENLPPCKWQLGRVLEVIPGKDKVIRVVKVKTATNTYLRSISKLCILPIDSN